MPLVENVYLTEFLELYAKSQERVVFFVGAGLSRPLFPAWTGLLHKLVEYTYSAGKLTYSKSELLKKLKKGEDYLDIAEACIGSLGVSGYRGFMEREFDKEIKPDDIPQAYKELFSLQPLTIVTTNYDRIPDVAGAGVYRIVTNRNAAEGQRQFEQGKKLVVKMHGDIGDHASLVLTGAEFDDVYFKNVATQNLIRSVFTTRTVLFLGFGLTDPHLDLILKSLRVASEGKPVTHYALLPEASRFDIDAIERKYGVKVISYTPSDDTHPEVVEFLRRLKTPTAGGATGSGSVDRASLGTAIAARLRATGHVHAAVVLGADKTVEVAVFCLGATQIEHQREILALVRAAVVNSPDVEKLKIHLHAGTEPVDNIIQFCPIILSCLVSYADAVSFCNGRTGAREFWSKIEFSVPASVGTVNAIIRTVDFPFIGVD